MTTANLIKKYADTLKRVEEEARQNVEVAREDWMAKTAAKEEARKQLEQREAEKDEAFGNLGGLSKTVRTLGKQQTEDSDKLDCVILVAEECKKTVKEVQNAKSHLSLSEGLEMVAKKEHSEAVEFWAAIKSVVSISR